MPAFGRAGPQQSLLDASLYNHRNAAGRTCTSFPNRTGRSSCTIPPAAPPPPSPAARLLLLPSPSSTSCMRSRSPLSTLTAMPWALAARASSPTRSSASSHGACGRQVEQLGQLGVEMATARTMRHRAHHHTHNHMHNHMCHHHHDASVHCNCWIGGVGGTCTHLHLGPAQRPSGPLPNHPHAHRKHVITARHHAVRRQAAAVIGARLSTCM